MKKALKAATLGALATTSLSIALSGSVHGAGADIKMGNFGSTVHSVVGTTHAYSLGSYTCNIGNADLAWLNRGTPGFAMNAYRLHNGRFLQIGMGNAKTACCVSNFTDEPNCGAGVTCSASGSGLRAGCRDHYSASFNSGQSRLAPRSSMNPQTGAISTSYSSGPAPDVIWRRLQINQADMTLTNYPGALFFAESHYVCTEDAQAHNDLNNASYQRVTFDGAFNMALTGGTFRAGLPAIYAWRDHGGGPGVPDPAVVIQPFDVPGEGTVRAPKPARFILGHKVIDNGNGTWRYEYAVYNFNSDRCAGGFHVPIPEGAKVFDVGFHAPDYHSDDALLYSNADWVTPDPLPSYEVRWSAPQTFAQNANTSALRWGSLYNFWFTCDQPPVAGHVELDMFKPATATSCAPHSVQIAASVPRADCPPDIARNGRVDVDDLIEVILGWGPCGCVHNCPADVVADNAVDVDDLFAVILGWGGCN